MTVKSRTAAPRPRLPLTVGILLYDDVQPLDIAGPLDVFGASNGHVSPAPAYRMHMLGRTNKPVVAENGLRLSPEFALEDAPALDTLVIPGGAGARRVLAGDSKFLGWLHQQQSTTRRMVSICTGAFALAGAGLLDGRRATTHWRYAAEFRERFPRVRLDIDQLYVQDGRFYTSGGLTAGLDLALSLVTADLGASVALAVARDLVMYMHRPGNQAQFSTPLDAQTRGTDRLEALVVWMLAHLREDLSVSRLAGRAHMSERNFRRVFTEAFGITPTRFVSRLRLERACILLSSGRQSVEAIAVACGFSHPDVFRRAFHSRYGTPPRDYRERFSAR